MMIEHICINKIWSNQYSHKYWIFFLFWTMIDIVHNTKVCIRLKIFVQIPFILKIYWNPHSINCTALTVTPAVSAAVPKLLYGPILSPQTSQIQFSPISRGGINWSVCRSNSLGTSHSTQGPDDSFSSSSTAAQD